MCFTVQLSRFLSVFDSFDILSYLFWLVKNFFKFFQTLFLLSAFLKASSNWMLSFCDSHIRLPYLFWLVNNFFNFFHNIWKFLFHITKIRYQLFPYRISCNLFTISHASLFVNNFFHNILNCVNSFELLWCFLSLIGDN